MMVDDMTICVLTTAVAGVVVVAVAAVAVAVVVVVVVLDIIVDLPHCLSCLLHVMLVEQGTSTQIQLSTLGKHRQASPHLSSQTLSSATILSSLYPSHSAPVNDLHDHTTDSHRFQTATLGVLIRARRDRASSPSRLLLHTRSCATQRSLIAGRATQTLDAISHHARGIC